MPTHFIFKASVVALASLGKRTSFFFQNFRFDLSIVFFLECLRTWGTLILIKNANSNSTRELSFFNPECRCRSPIFVLCFFHTNIWGKVSQMGNSFRTIYFKPIFSQNNIVFIQRRERAKAKIIFNMVIKNYPELKSPCKTARAPGEINL